MNQTAKRMVEESNSSVGIYVIRLKTGRLLSQGPFRKVEEFDSFDEAYSRALSIIGA